MVSCGALQSMFSPTIHCAPIQVKSTAKLVMSQVTDRNNFKRYTGLYYIIMKIKSDHLTIPNISLKEFLIFGEPELLNEKENIEEKQETSTGVCLSIYRISQIRTQLFCMMDRASVS